MSKTIRFFGALTLVLVLLGVLIASSWPDGLERVAETLGFAGRAGPESAWSPFADYEAAFLEHSWPAQVTAGLLGVVLMYAFGTLLGKALKKKGDG
jgi:hypothetical protein